MDTNWEPRFIIKAQIIGNISIICQHTKKPINTVFLTAYWLEVTESDFEMEAKMILASLRTRKYPPKSLIKPLMKQDRKPEINYFNGKQHLMKMLCIVTYNINNPPVRETIKCHDDLLRHTKKQAFEPQDLKIIYRKSSNLKDLIISGYINRSVEGP